ncbi:SDR family NAD(P)-dependent oxidoreductase [Chryseolinea sp. T2]|uniref:SDR family NAD(P)-dependent oxidoreductase n=1 Tax=Chryseolinea sp. T2 TaxID=3129255 RepID=UPI00307728EA
MKTVFITGAAGNLGQATVDKFLSEGYKVIATTTDKTSGSMPKEVEVHQVDLSDEDAVEETIQQVLTKHKTLDAALFLAGGYAHGGIADTDFARLDRMIALNFQTAFFAAQRIFQQMITQKEGGRLVFIGARAGLDPKAASTSLAYGLSKSLIFYFADILNATAHANAHGSKVTASVVVPSTIDTPQNRTAMPKADFSHWVKAEEIADTLHLIADKRAASWRETVIKVYGLS